MNISEWGGCTKMCKALKLSRAMQIQVTRQIRKNLHSFRSVAVLTFVTDDTAIFALSIPGGPLLRRTVTVVFGKFSVRTFILNLGLNIYEMVGPT